MKWSEVAQSCPILCNPMDCSLSGSSVYGIFQARVLEWIAISFSRGSSRPRKWTPVSHITGRIDAFELWCWRKLLRVPWTTRRFNQFILKETSPEYSLEGLLLKLKLHYFDHLMWRADSLEKTLMLGKAGGEGDDRGQDGWMASLIQWTWVWASSVGWWRIGKPGMLQSMGLQRVRHDWTTTKCMYMCVSITELLSHKLTIS